MQPAPDSFGHDFVGDDEGLEDLGVVQGIEPLGDALFCPLGGLHEALGNLGATSVVEGDLLLLCEPACVRLGDGFELAAHFGRLLTLGQRVHGELDTRDPLRLDALHLKEGHPCRVCAPANAIFAIGVGGAVVAHG